MPMQTKRKNLKDTLRRRRVLTYFICLLIAFVFWLLNTSNNQFSKTLTVPVNYINIPENELITNQLPKEVEITLHGTGYDVVSFLIMPDQGKIFLDGKKTGIIKKQGQTFGFFLTQSGLSYFNKQHADVKALDIKPDTIFFQLLDRSFKRVPVKLNVSLDFDKQYGVVDENYLDVDSVDISGEKEIVDTVTFIETESFNQTGINSSFNKSLKLKAIEGLYLNPSEVNLSIQVEQYTEHVLEVPLQIKNNITADSIVTMPAKIKILFLVSLNDFIKIQRDDFEVMIDASELKKGKNIKVPVQIFKSPTYAKNIKLSPEKVEYIIIKP